jgi:DNA-binding MarR family transcriptional regulator
MESLDPLLTIARIKTPCDLDLLLFFARHPRALMTSEQLASFVGYDLPQIAKSLDLLVQRKLLRRSQNPTHAARLYSFRTDFGGPRFHELLKAASTVEGRRQIRRLLTGSQPRPKRPAPRKAAMSFTPIAAGKEKAHG